MKKQKGFFQFLNFMAVLLMIGSIVLGGVIVENFGVIETELYGGIMTTETNYMGAFSGFFIIVQGLAAGAFMLCFSLVGQKIIEGNSQINTKTQ